MTASVWILVTLVLLVVLVLATRKVVSIQKMSAAEVLDEEIGRLRARVHNIHDAIFAPPRRGCCPTLQEALNEAKIRLNLLDQGFAGEIVPELPDLMIQAASAVQYAETLAAANGIVLPVEEPPSPAEVPTGSRIGLSPASR